jgi:hypothetical protein
MDILWIIFIIYYWCVGVFLYYFTVFYIVDASNFNCGRIRNFRYYYLPRVARKWIPLSVPWKLYKASALRLWCAFKHYLLGYLWGFIFSSSPARCVSVPPRRPQTDTKCPNSDICMCGSNICRGSTLSHTAQQEPMWDKVEPLQILLPHIHTLTHINT